MWCAARDIDSDLSGKEPGGRRVTGSPPQREGVRTAD